MRLGEEDEASQDTLAFVDWMASDRHVLEWPVFERIFLISMCQMDLESFLKMRRALRAHGLYKPSRNGRGGTALGQSRKLFCLGTSSCYVASLS
jgi:hypothetical protein